MSYASKELKTCSRCHSTVLEKYFLTNRKGELYKTCDNCRSKRNSDKAKETKAIYNAEHREENKEYWRKYKEQNRDKINETNREKNKPMRLKFEMLQEFKAKYKPVM